MPDTATLKSTKPKAKVEHFDVLIVGAGISGVGAAYHLKTQTPKKKFVVLEAYDTFGGTWHMHRYPGIRSDSDLYTFGYRHKPWVGPPIASREEILKYMDEVIAENDLGHHIRYRHRVLRASCSRDAARWTVESEVDGTGSLSATGALGSAAVALAQQLGSLLAEVSSVREFFSVTAGRMLSRLAESRAQLRWLIPADGSATSDVDIARIDGRNLEAILIDLASLVGLWNESVLHGPAWRFGEVGRRLERAFELGAIDSRALQRGYDAVHAITLHADAAAFRRESLRRCGTLDA